MSLSFRKFPYYRLLVFLTICLLSSLSAAAQPKTDRETAGLVGPVKSVRSKSVDYSGKETAGEGILKKAGDLVIYDQAGRETEREMVSDYGEAMGKVSQTFDAQGLLTGSIWTGPKGNVISKDVYTYLNGKRVEQLKYDGAGVLVEKTVKSYDSAGRLETDTYYDPAKPVAKTVYKYEGKNEPIEVAFFLANGRKATAPVGPCLGAHRVTYTYNNEGRVVNKVLFEDDGSFKKGFQYGYDERGNTMKYLSQSRSLSVTYVYKYEFDQKGNWIKQTATGTSIANGLDVFGKAPTPYIRTTVNIREIIYY